MSGNFSGIATIQIYVPVKRETRAIQRAGTHYCIWLQLSNNLLSQFLFVNLDIRRLIMPPSYLDIELSKYWPLLSPEQKKSLLGVITAFAASPEIKNQLQEPDATYNIKDESLWLKLLQQLSDEQKEALIILIESFGVEIPGQRISIEQYNTELDEAEKDIERGESVTHEEMIAMSKKWVHGK